MNKTVVWGHRGAGFRGIENTMPSFKKAVDMGVDGIKTEAQHSKDGKIFLSSQESLKRNGEYVAFKDMDSKEINNLRTDNNKEVLSLTELFNEFKGKNIRYNFDIKEPEIGIKIIEIARQFNLVDKIELAKTATDSSPLPKIFGKIREFDQDVTLINSLFLKNATNEKNHLELESMRELNIQGINVKYNYANFELFKLVKDNGFKFYVWGVLFNRSMQKLLKMNYNGQSVDSMMSNFPDRLVRLRNKFQTS
ncbi:glycerophosphodiester phosphodiesterase [Promethearchaeum syntrophicum]|uniref:Glycerophosphodiester phosphodiesterase n=1 Tax=Promethearchaeum syntrophicum TaxID=2594042 RepID=A0A5B9DCQ9_9ARCH|nr:glycerophosphodiester phosphodiesterase family protein [Candidatus Prometheoarchaeum syntrophicum]QEE16486.1 cytoplasmic glycerophosphodiester phosphodiesterase [Candidatus Prometheoarchaeum syntrophicum]